MDSPVSSPSPISRASSARANRRRGSFGQGEGLFRAAGVAATGVLIGALGVIVVALAREAGTQPLGGALAMDWSPSRGQFGLVPLLLGTLISSALGVVLAAPLAILAAIFVVDLAAHRVRRRALAVIDVAATMPGVVFGLWGRAVVVPATRRVLVALGVEDAHGFGLLPAGLVLAAMTLPTMLSLTCNVLGAVPASLRETALALGASRWEAIRHVVLPASWPGIAGAIAVGAARALGESVAVELVCGSSPVLPSARLAQASTLATNLVDEYAEAIGAAHLGALAQSALLLAVIAVVVDWSGRRLVARVGAGHEGGRGSGAAGSGERDPQWSAA